MDIELPCEKCGHPMRFAREQGGRMGKCPSCGNDVYIPTPEEELEELPLAPEDQSEEQRERELQDERRRLDRTLAQERDEQPARPRGGVGRTSVKGVVMTYLTAMRDSDLQRAEEALALLATSRDEALRVIDRLAADQIPPAEMANVPPGVFQGFLKTLRSRL